MEPISVLLLSAVIAKIVTTHTEDREYARQGLESPRMKMRQKALDAALARIQAGSKEKAPRPPSRLGASGYARELWYDAWDDLRDHRVKVRQERKDGTRPTVKQQALALKDWSKRSLNRRPDGKPVDDMIDVVSDSKVESKPTGDSDGQRATVCPECKSTLTREGGQWEHPQGRECGVYGLTDVTVDTEPEEPTTVVHDGEEYQAGVTPMRLTCGFCEREYPSTRRATIDGEPSCQDCAARHVAELAAVGDPEEARRRERAAKSKEFYRQQAVAHREREILAHEKAKPEEARRTEERTEMNQESTSLDSAIAFATEAAVAHASFSAETYVGSLEQMGMSGSYTESARAAMEASTNAAAAWAAHAEELKTQKGLQEMYRANSAAANKEALING